MICPRCADEHIEVMATSPVKGSGPFTSASIVCIPGAIPNRCAVPAASTIRKRSA
jgi:hypothetical protein